MAHFGHRDHLELAWNRIREGRSDEILPFLQHLTETHGDHDKLNATMTRFWADATAHAIWRSGGESFEGLLAAEPHLLVEELPLRHWRPETLFSPAAKAAWLEPDLAPLPF
jgi:hypothetical protein